MAPMIRSPTYCGKLLPLSFRAAARGRTPRGLTNSPVVLPQGEVIPHQEAPPRPGALRASNGALAPTPEMAQVVRNLSQHGLSRLQLQRLAALEAAVPHLVDDAEAPS